MTKPQLTHTEILGYIDSVSKRIAETGFSWGSLDCCTFVCGLVQKATGSNPIQNLETPYHDIKSAKKLLKREGGIASAATKYIGEPQTIAQAKIGDVVCCDMGDGDALGVCLGLHSVFVSEHGMEYTSTFNCDTSWKYL